MTSDWIVPLVEGHGEVQALPALLHRIRQADAPQLQLLINPPIRVRASGFRKDRDYRTRMVTLAAQKARQRQPALVLTLLDAEDDCPAKSGPGLRTEMHSLAGDVDHLVVFAYREYETWFLAAGPSLGITDLPHPASKVRDAKGELARRLPSGRYLETADQLPLSRRFDLDQAMAEPSFARLRRRLLARWR